MGKKDKLLADILSGRKDGNIGFADLCYLLESLGIKQVRVSGSHHIYAVENVVELIDLQPDKKDHSKAKRYQVKQVRDFINRYIKEE